MALSYKITSENGNVLLDKKETVAVETQANFVKTFTIPKDSVYGKYKFNAKITYADGKEALAESSFDVIAPKKSTSKLLIFYPAVLIALILVLIFFSKKLKEIAERLSIRIKVWQIVRRRMKVLKVKS